MYRDESGETLNIHATLGSSRANGPGVRSVVWLQGCTLGCSGCFNPETHPSHLHSVVRITVLVEAIHRHQREIEGITLSGGEPLQQPHGVLRFLRAVRRGTPLTTLLFSGYEREEIERMSLGREILQELDVLIAGRYRRELHLGKGLRGSSNQTIHLLSDRYSLEQTQSVPESEIYIRADGRIVATGVGGFSTRHLTPVSES